jgi:hypothetical protein
MNKSYFDPKFCIKYRKKFSNNTIEFVIMLKNGHYRIDEQVSFTKELVFKESFFGRFFFLLARTPKLGFNCYIKEGKTSQADYLSLPATIKHVYKWYDHTKSLYQVKEAKYDTSAFLDKDRKHEEYFNKSWLLSEFY